MAIIRDIKQIPIHFLRPGLARRFLRRIVARALFPSENPLYIPVHITRKEHECFSCFETFTFTKDRLPKTHKKLKIALCDKCAEYLESDDWTFTDGKSDYCIISGDGGEIVSCDTKGCKNSFDINVLKKWLPKKMLKTIINDDDAFFKCFACNPRLGHYPEFMAKTKGYMNAFKQTSDSRKRMRENSTNGSSNSKQKMPSEAESRKFLLKHIQSCPVQYKESTAYKEMMKCCK